MSHFTRSRNIGSARSQVDIREVRDGILILPGNRYRKILNTSSLNFELQSEEEQDVIVDSFQSFLNSLNSPIQILIRVRELDIDRYIEDFEAERVNETKEIYKQQLINYCDFIRKLVSGNKILSRRFFLIIPFDSNTPVDFSIAKEQLNLQQEIIVKGLEKLGMTARALSTLEVLDLYYSIYRPDQAKTQPLSQEIVRMSNEQNYL